MLYSNPINLKGDMMYKLIVAISFIIRNFCLPNPFVDLKNGMIINLMVEPLLYLITFGVVGLFYQRGSNPILGSFIYLLFYAIHTGLIMLCGIFLFNKTIMIIIVTLYIMILKIVVNIKNKFNNW